ncbi:MAG: TRAM domain-containing protein [Ignavibacteria bacterium]
MLKHPRTLVKTVLKNWRETSISPKKRSPRNAKNKRRRHDCPVEIGNEYEVEITEIMSNGEGLAAVKGFWIFVPNVKVGDKVRVRVTTVDSVSADAEVISQA